jgi:hypothetical protein
MIIENVKIFMVSLLYYFPILTLSGLYISKNTINNNVNKISDSFSINLN